MNQMELIRKSLTKFYEALQSSVILRLKLDDQIFFSDKTKKEVKIIDVIIPVIIRVGERELGKIEKKNA